MSGRLAASLLAGTVLAACAGGAGAGQAPGGVTHLSAPATLPASAVSYLPSHLKPLTPTGLARETRSPALAGELGAWGFVGGADRYFQGESRALQVVDSRTLRFRTPGGAAEYVRFMRAHAVAILGSFPAMRRFASQGRSGFLAIAQQCQCHLANPALLAVLARGGLVTWLEINGPGASRRQLSRLLVGAP
jgi:hypothetical protein